MSVDHSPALFRPFDHPEQDRLAAFVEGRLPAAEADLLDDHVSDCPRCAARAAELRAVLADGLGRPARWWRRHPYMAPALVGVAVLTLSGVTWWLSDVRAPQGARPPLMMRMFSPRVEPVTLRDGGGQFLVRPNGKVEGGDGLSPPYRELVQRVLRERRIPASSLPPDLTGRDPLPASQSPQPALFSLNNPVGVLLLENRFPFSWQPLPRATGYQVEVYNSRFEKVLESALLKPGVTEWTPPRPLPRGDRYRWRVTAFRGSKAITVPTLPAPEIRFQIVGAETARELQQAQETYPDHHLLLAALYGQAGLLELTERELLALAASNPGSELVAGFLKRVREVRSS